MPQLSCGESEKGQWAYGILIARAHTDNEMELFWLLQLAGLPCEDEKKK